MSVFILTKDDPSWPEGPKSIVGVFASKKAAEDYKPVDMENYGHEEGSVYYDITEYEVNE